MDFQSKKEKGAVIASIKGRVDAVTAPQLEKQLSAQCSGDEKVLIVDMNGIDYISSAGLRVVLSIAKKMKTKKGDMLLTGIRGSVKEVFEISGFLSIFKVFENVEAALKQI